jgi:hypothetical protein
VRNEVLTSEESASLRNSLSAPLRLFSGFNLLSKIEGRFTAVRAAGVFWIQALAEFWAQAKLLQQHSALRFAMTPRAPATISA